MTPARTLRVLLWLEELSPQGLASIRDIDDLQGHLHHDLEDVCDIQLLVPNMNERLISQARIWGLRVRPVERASVNEEIWPEIDDLFLRESIATARREDCDYIVVPQELLPYLEAVDRQCHIGLVEFSFLLRCIEIFVRGFGVAWSFANPVLNVNFNNLYHSELQETVKVGFDLMNRLTTAKQDSTTVYPLRTLLFNRLPHVCFSRDQRLFYLLQRDAELRNGANRHSFAFEVNYHLNFYYILLYGALDHAALVTNEICRLGVAPQKVGASITYMNFHKKLESSSPLLHAVFADAKTTGLLQYLGAFRHLTAHRGSISPTILVQKPDRDPTDEEIDAYLSESGEDPQFRDFDDDPHRAELQACLRSIAKMELLEKNPTASDVVPVEIDGKWGWTWPLLDVTQSFRATLRVLQRIFDECMKVPI